MSLKQALNHELILKKVHTAIRFNQDKKQNIILRKIFSSWWIMQFLDKLWKMWENIEILKL